MKHLVLLSLALPAFSCVGCHHFEAPEFRRPDGANGKEVLVIPFGEPSRRRWYTESERGDRLVKSFKTWANANADDPRFAEGPSAERVIRVVRNEWVKESISGREWADLTRGLGIDYVLVGNVGKTELRQPEVIGLYRATMEIDIEVFDVVRGKRVFEKSLTVRHTSDQGGGPLADLAGFENDKQVESRLISEAGKRIGQELYGYYPD